MALIDRIKIPEAVVPPENIWSIEHIDLLMTQIEELINEPYNEASPDDMQNRMLDLASMYGASANICASAKWYLAAVHKAEFRRIAEAIKKKGVPEDLNGMASAINIRDYIKSCMADWIWLSEKADRLNSAITHAIDAMRTALSRAKEERKLEFYASRGGVVPQNQQ